MHVIRISTALCMSKMTHAGQHKLAVYAKLLTRRVASRVYCAFLNTPPCPTLYCPDKIPTVAS